MAATAVRVIDGDVGDVVEHPRGQDDCPGHDRVSSPGEADGTVADFAVLDFGGHDLDAVAGQFGAAAAAQVRRVQAVVSTPSR